MKNLYHPTPYYHQKENWLWWWEDGYIKTIPRLGLPIINFPGRFREETPSIFIMEMILERLDGTP